VGLWAVHPSDTRSDNLIFMAEISATEAARNFADLLDAIEHRGEHFTITRRGRAVAQLEPVGSGRGADVKRLLTAQRADDGWSDDLASVRALAVPQDRS
jgi:prevent-host-death family protein